MAHNHRVLSSCFSIQTPLPAILCSPFAFWEILKNAFRLICIFFRYSAVGSNPFVPLFSIGEKLKPFFWLAGSNECGTTYSIGMLHFSQKFNNLSLDASVKHLHLLQTYCRSRTLQTTGRIQFNLIQPNGLRVSSYINFSHGQPMKLFWTHPWTCFHVRHMKVLRLFFSRLPKTVQYSNGCLLAETHCTTPKNKLEIVMHIQRHVPLIVLHVRCFTVMLAIKGLVRAIQS